MPETNYTTYTTSQLSSTPVWATISYPAPTLHDVTWVDTTTASPRIAVQETTATGGSDYYRWIDPAEWNALCTYLEGASKHFKKSDPEPDKEKLLQMLE